MIKGPVWNEQDLARHNVFPTVLAIGDSWFWYLKGNLPLTLHPILNQRRQHIMLVRGANGAEASDFVTEPIWSQMAWDLDRTRGYGNTIQAVFLSGGGNDLAGPDDFVPLLQPDCSSATQARQCFQPGEPAALFSKVTTALARVITLVQQKIPGTPVFVHGYDYANPNGRGFLGLGQWLKVPMDLCGVPVALHQEVVNHCIDGYWQELLALRARFPGVLHLVDLRGTLKPADWANELHPRPAGFKRLAQRWQPVLQQAGIA
ncbi:MAG: SGNH/GDSL hydrolase family protein [Roseateles sp.]|uniref:SGNH/GDSL hydrolase family protein n=1 Tax=Roseateles sp. TaxID=1971397 RepID=UPI0039E9D137